MNGNDRFAGSDVSNLTAMLPSLDCILFFTKLNSRCFLAEELLEKVRGCCKVRMILSHVDTCLRNKFYNKIPRDKVDEKHLVEHCMDTLCIDRDKFCDDHRIPVSDAVLWTSERALRDLQPLYKDVLLPHLKSTHDMADWLKDIVH